MKKSFKFSAILLALITSVSGLAPIGAIPPLKPDAKSEEKSKEMPQKRAREDEDSEEESTESPQKRVREDEDSEEKSTESPQQREREDEDSEELRQRRESTERLLGQYRKPSVTPLQLLEKREELWEFRNTHRKIMDDEIYNLQLLKCLVPGGRSTLRFQKSSMQIIHLDTVKRNYYENREEVSSDIKRLLDNKVGAELPNGNCITPNQLTALSLFVMLSYLQEKNREESGSNVAVQFTDIGYNRLRYLLAISRFNRDPSVPELDTDTPPDRIFFDTVDICYDHDEMSIKMSFYFRGNKFYESILRG